VSCVHFEMLACLYVKCVRLCVAVEAARNNVLQYGWCDGCASVWFGSSAEICVTVCRTVRASGTNV
jgi:hypothetical protein